MPQSSIELERDGDVAVLWLNAPETLNAIDLEMVEGLDQALDASVPWARCITILGRGRAFSSGAKLSGGNSAMGKGEADVGATLDSHINPLLTKLRQMPIPWISGVGGAAAGVGCSLALAADLIIAGEGAYFLQAFSRIGLVPDGGASFLLSRAIGRVRAMEMMLLGEKIPAAKALAWGLINDVVPDDKLHDAVMSMAFRLAQGPTRTLGMIREVAWAGTELSWHEALATERRLQCKAGRTQDFFEGVSAFLEKRPARFSGT